jgi:hypothetical protein
MRTSLAALALVPLLGLACLACDDKKDVAPAPLASAPPAVTSVASVAAAPSAPPVRKDPESIAAQHVLVAYRGAERAPKTVTRSKADAKKRAEEVAAKAQAGADFTALVNEYSDDPGAKERLGSLGKFTRDKMAKAFSDAAFALDVDKTSGVVETPFGFHVIKRNQ